jgi:hypothetical protein
VLFSTSPYFSLLESAPLTIFESYSSIFDLSDPGAVDAVEPDANFFTAWSKSRSCCCATWCSSSLSAYSPKVEAILAWYGFINTLVKVFVWAWLMIRFFKSNLRFATFV